MRKCSLVLLVTILPGCAWVNENFYDRLLFVEESHIGLKAKIGLDHTPGDVDFGYRRSVLALIPKADANDTGLKATEKAARIKAKKEAEDHNMASEEAAAHIAKAAEDARNAFIAEANKSRPAVLGDDPDCPAEEIDRREPLSVISSFSADVRWFEATRVRTYFATGIAAARTACDVRAIRALVSTPNE
jgi:hypothetical protein